jgi:hypothetical protein
MENKRLSVPVIDCRVKYNYLIDIMINLVEGVKVNICYLHSETCSTIHASNAYHILCENNL